jgi:hypothetical protein
MRRGREYRGLPLAAIVALMGVALTAFVVSTGSIPHVHAGPQVGLYNQEHDLTYLATVGGGAPPPEGAPVPLDGAGVAAVCILVGILSSAPCRLADCRAPPSLG